MIQHKDVKKIVEDIQNETKNAKVDKIYLNTYIKNTKREKINSLQFIQDLKEILQDDRRAD